MKRILKFDKFNESNSEYFKSEDGVRLNLSAAIEKILRDLTRKDGKLIDSDSNVVAVDTKEGYFLDYDLIESKLSDVYDTKIPFHGDIKVEIENCFHDISPDRKVIGDIKEFVNEAYVDNKGDFHWEDLPKDNLIGKRVRLISMVDDPRPIEPGTEGTIKHIDGIGNIHVDWDNGRKLALIEGVDEYEII